MAALRQPTHAQSVLSSSSPSPSPTPLHLRLPIQPTGLRILTGPSHCSSTNSTGLQGTPWIGARASAAPPGSPSSPSRCGSLPWRELKDYAWVYGPATGRSFSASTQPNSGHYSSDSSTCTHSSQAVPDVANEDTVLIPKSPEPSPPPITLAALIRDSFKETQVNCTAQIARLGKDSDSEVVHDLRVVLRRLRNMLRLFYPFLHISEDLEPKHVSHLLRVLGAVRDSGAMMETLDKVEAKMGAELDVMGSEHNWSEGVPVETGSMVAVLEAVRMELRGLEQQQLAEACAQLRSRQGRRLFRSLEEWAEDPALGLSHMTTKVRGKKGRQARMEMALHEARTLASPVTGMSPSILAPYVASLLLHPAWHLEDIWLETNSSTQDCTSNILSLAAKESSFHPANDGNGGIREGPVPKPDEHLCECAHDLRKHLRELRYAMELLVPGYLVSGETEDESEERPQVLVKHYKEALAEVKGLQGVLGELQDLQVLAAFLAGYGEEQRRQHKKGRKGKGRAKKDVVGVSLVQVQAVIMEMQIEVWNKWISEKEQVNCEKGRYKLFKAILKKPQQNDDKTVKGKKVPSEVADTAAGEGVISFNNNSSENVPETNSYAENTDRSGSTVAVLSNELEGRADYVEPSEEGLSSSTHPPVAATSCRLWSNRSAERDEWEHYEELPKDMLADVLADIALVEPSELSV